MSGAPKQPLNFEPAEPREENIEHQHPPPLRRHQGSANIVGDGPPALLWLHPEPQRRHCPLACSIS
jgi:hypothetical protein